MVHKKGFDHTDSSYGTDAYSLTYSRRFYLPGTRVLLTTFS